MLYVVEAKVQTRLDVLPQDPDVVVPVGAALFVVEAEGVEQLVLDGAVVEAALTVQRQSLGITTTPHVGVTAAFKQLNKKQAIIKAGRNRIFFFLIKAV